jgi:hypothetical protein
MDLQKLMSGLVPGITSGKTENSAADAASRRPATANGPAHVQRHDRPETPDAFIPSDATDRADARSAKNEEIARKLAEKLPDPEAKNYTDILKIVNQYAPHVMKSIRAIIANRAGLEGAAQQGPSPDQLASTLQAAAGSPDPSRRVADVVTGVGLVPENLKDKFLKAAEALLQMESSHARNAWGYQPLEGADPEIAVDPNTGGYQPRNTGYSVEVNFDLFFSLSARSSVKSGESLEGSFYEATSEVAAEFEANFSIEVAGRFLNLADAAEEIDPAVMESFSKAVQGLAGLDQDALNRFFDATDKLFGELGEMLGLSEGELDGVKEEVKATAQAFFEGVSGSLAGVFPGVSADQIFSLPAELDSNGSTDLLSLLAGVADAREKPEDARGLLEALTAAENARSLRDPEDLSPMETLLEESLPLAA